MAIETAAITKIVSQLTTVVPKIISKYRQSGLQRKVMFLDMLEEAQDNLTMLKEDYIRNAAAHNLIIDNLENEKLKELIKAIRYKKFSPKAIVLNEQSKDLCSCYKQYKQFNSMGLQDFLVNINKKIKELKIKRKLYQENESGKYKPDIRLRNLIKMYELLFARLKL